MHVLVATDGKLDIATTVAFVVPLVGDDAATVLTVTEIPRALLRDLRSDFGEQEGPKVHSDAEYVGVSGGGSSPSKGYPGDDAIIDQYLTNRQTQICAPVVSALSAAGVEATSHSVEGENAAATILDFIRSSDADIVLVGSHGQGRFEGLLGSTGVKVTRLSPVPVLVVRKATD